MDKYLREQTAERKEVVRAQIAANEEGASDAFSLLVRANELDDTTAQGGRSSGKLSDEELVRMVSFACSPPLLTCALAEGECVHPALCGARGAFRSSTAPSM